MSAYRWSSSALMSSLAGHAPRLPSTKYWPRKERTRPALPARSSRHAGCEVKIWGTGTPRREFMHVDDLADGIAHLVALENPPDWVNVGTGVDVSILELAHMVAKAVGLTRCCRCCHWR